MRQGNKVDGSLAERHAILELLSGIRGEQVEIAGLEEIGRVLRQAGEKALRPLLRLIAAEKRGKILSRYLYLLDFFPADLWGDQLVRIALKARDLSDEAKAAFQVTLKGYGIDVELPPFRPLFGADSPSLIQTLNGAGKLEDEAVVSFLDDLLCYPAEVQGHVIGELGRHGSPAGVRMLEALLWHQDRHLVESALKALGRTQLRSGAQALASFLTHGEERFLPLCRKSLRRLSFLGITPPPLPEPLPFHAGYASPPDGDGYRALLLSRWQRPGQVMALYMQVHERRGLLAAWGGQEMSLDAFELELEAFNQEEELYPVAPEYVVGLVGDALYWSRDLAYLPADFYLHRALFAGAGLTPTRYRPDLAEHLPARNLSYREGEEASAKLMDDPFFSGWFIVEQRVYEFAERYRGGAELEQVLQEFCAELLTPQLDRIKERLFLSADLMRQTGSEREAVARVVALARSLESYRLPHHLHPFLRSFALESMEAAREALSEGYDLRREAE